MALTNMSYEELEKFCQLQIEICERYRAGYVYLARVVVEMAFAAQDPKAVADIYWEKAVPFLPGMPESPSPNMPEED